MQCRYEINQPHVIRTDCFFPERTLRGLYQQVRGCKLIDYKMPPRRVGF